MKTLQIDLSDSAATDAFGARLASRLRDGGVVFLSGDLGAGKTTLVRSLLRTLGHDGAVRSPTYAIVEPYRIGELEVFHLDLYRIADPDELEYLGLREWLRPGVLVLVEWPERGQGALPKPDLHLHLDYAGEGRRLRIDAADDFIAGLEDAT